MIVTQFTLKQISVLSINKSIYIYIYIYTATPAAVIIVVINVSYDE